MAYIETRKTWIKAIHKCIEEKWGPVCMGCDIDIESSENCALCRKDNSDCYLCPLAKSGNKCTSFSSTFMAVSDNCNCDKCDEFFKTTPCSERVECPLVAHDEAEAMREALVQLLPPEERKRYEP
jgi:hypothetical protein